MQVRDYQAPVRPLRGCVNDIQRFETLLEAWAGAAGDILKRRMSLAGSLCLNVGKLFSPRWDWRGSLLFDRS